MAKKSLKAELKEANQTDFEKNYASDGNVCDRFLEYAMTPLQTARDNRLEMERVWLEDYKLWSCVLNDEGYKGMSNLFVAELNNQVESSVEKGLTATFPTSDYITAVPTKSMSQDDADKIRDAVQYQLEEKSRIQMSYDLHLRQKILYGASVLRGSFVKDMVKVFIRQKDADGKMEVKPKLVPKFHGVKWEPVDMFHWYLFPEKATIDSADFVFEDNIVSLPKMERSGLYLNLEGLGSLDAAMDNDWVDIERMQVDKLTTAIKRHGKSALFTEIFCMFDIDGETPIPVRAIVANKKTVVRLTANPFWFQTPPYQGSTYIQRPGGLFYGMSLPDKIRSQQYQMNDLANQTQDSINYALNPMMVIDPALAGDVNSMKTKPGARWLGSKDGVNPITFPDVSQAGLRAMQETRGQIAQFSDNTPGIAPQLQGKSRSATQASIVQSSVGARQRLMAKSEEQQVLAPICKKTHIMLQQYMTIEYQIRVQGPDAGSWITKTVKPEDMCGDVDFVWKGQSEAEKTAVYAQQLLQLYQSALQTSAVMPGEIDLPALFKLVAKDALHIHGLDRIFTSIRKAKTVDPDLENIALMEEQDVDVNNGDNDENHIRSHELSMEKCKTDEQKLVHLRHIEKHEVQARGKADLAQAKAKLDALKALAQNPEQADGREGPAAPGLMEGNQQSIPADPAAVYSGVGV